MTPDKDQSIAKLLDDSQEMIRRFEEMTGQQAGAEISAAVQKDTLEHLEDAVEPTADGFFDLFIEEDAMTALAEFRPPSGEGKPLSLDQIEQALAGKQIVHGLLWNNVSQALEDCNLGRQLKTGVIVAQGTAPTPAIPAHLAIEARWLHSPQPAGEPSKDIDFKELTPFVMVNQGDLLAIRIAEVPGVSGTNVLGQEVPFVVEKHPEWIPGDHVVDTPVGLEAGIDGRLVLASPRIEVNPILELKEGVGYKTGNIHFKGEVVIQGRVSTGFAIEAGGGLVCRDVLDAFHVKTGGDLSTPAGIIGNGDARVEVGGAVTAKFLEHVYLLAQGDVRAETCILNSVVKTRGRCHLGEKGILAGGQLHVLNGVEVYQIGTATGPRTELYLGLDFQGMERILWIRERSRELHDQLKKVDAAIPHGGQRIQELMAAAKKLRVEIVQLTEQARSQLANLAQNEEATVEVRGSVYPGTHIEICHVPFLVTQTMTAVRFVLDKRKGTIAVESLGSQNSKTTTHSAMIQKKR